MRFLIKTTAQVWRDTPEADAPCEAAELAPVILRGNHRPGRGHGTDLVTERWFLTLTTAEELLALAEEVGCNLIVGPPYCHPFDDYEYQPALPEILVYDGSIE